jgi:hypothetical protein
MIHNKDCEPCSYCRHREMTLERRRLARHRARKAHMIAKRDAIMSGKVVVLTLRDEFTGYFYRYNKHGQMITLGCGHNAGA